MEENVPAQKENFISRELLHNSKVKKNLAVIRNTVADCCSADDIVDAVNVFPEGMSIKYQNKIFWIWFSMTLVLFGLVFYFYNEGGSIYLFLAPAASLIAALVFRKSDASRKKLVDFVEDSYVQRKYGFEYGREIDEVSHESLMSDYGFLFKRGNYDNQIPQYGSGYFQHNGKDVPYIVYNYHFVVEKKEVRRDSSGKEKVEYRYEHYDKWGVCFSGVKADAFSITSYKNKFFPVRWTTSSIGFNKRHFVTGGNEIGIAKLMQPSNVLMFEKLFSGQSHFELVHDSSKGTACWVFDDNVFKKENSGRQTYTTAKELGKNLSNLKLPVYEDIFNRLKSLIKEVVQ